MKKRKIIGGLLLLLLIFALLNDAALQGEEIGRPYPEREEQETFPKQQGVQEKEPARASFEMYGNFGTAILTDLETGDQKIYYKLALQPELTFGKFGFGLNLEFYFDENSNLRKEDWSWSKTIEKIWYARYGYKYEPV